MGKFNFLRTDAHNRDTNIGRVRTRAVAKDRYAGLRGHDYLEARAREPIQPEDDVPVTPAWLR